MNHMPACLQNQAPAILWALWNNLLRYAILYALPPLYMAMERGVPMSLTAFLLSIMAGVIANYISKWLDERDDGDEPRD